MYTLRLTKRELVALNHMMTMPEAHRRLAGIVDLYELTNKLLFAFGPGPTCTAVDAQQVGCDDLHGLQPLDVTPEVPHE